MKLVDKAVFAILQGGVGVRGKGRGGSGGSDDSITWTIL